MDFPKNIEELNERQLKDTLREAERTIAEQNSRIFEVKRQLQEQKDANMETNNQLAAHRETNRLMRQSTSWRVTRPLRKVMARLKGQTTAEDPARMVDKVQAEREQQRPLDYNANSTVHDILKKKFHALEAIPSLQLEAAGGPRLNFVTDSIEPRFALGGVATALIVATEFARRNGMPLRIITRTAPVHASDYIKLMRVNGVTPAPEVTFFTDYERDTEGEQPFKLDVSDQDIFFATSWWGAHAIKKTTKRKRFFYIIQEVETFFYPHGGDHYLCSRVMNDPQIDFIVNSHYLFDYFKTHTPNIAQNGAVFEPAFPAALYHAENFAPREKYKLFFYARPGNPRNLFYYGIEMLERAIETGILDTNKWDICCAGQDVPPLRFAGGAVAENAGLLSWERYGELLRKTDLALSLMYTPHPSYPPYDAACSGSVVLSNQCENKADFPDCKNVILGNLEEGAFMEAFGRAVRLAEDMGARKANYEQSSICREWGPNIEGALAFMKERL